ncbi:MAG: putative transcriptional regulator [Ulvibacter sp.]|jgi:predicted transcriptional regulator
MSTIELRKMLIERINSTEDNKLLLEASRLMEIQLSEIDIPFQLTNEMNEAVDEALEQIKTGDFLTHEQAEKEIDEWLEK